jgi:hypothetical protein
VPLLQIKTIFVAFGHHFGLLCLLASIPFALLVRKGKRKEM